MYRSSLMKALLCTTLIAGASATAAKAEDSTFVSTTTGYVVAPVRYAGKFLMMPTRIFRRGSDHEIVSTTTTRTVTYDKTATIGAGPGIVVTKTDGVQSVVSTTSNANPVLYVTTGAPINSFNVYLPNDLLTRRDDLIARIYTEKANGKLSDSQASILLSEVQTVASMPYPTTCERTTASARQVKMIYRSFDKVSNDILMESKQGDKQLAGRYSFISL